MCNIRHFEVVHVITFCSYSSLVNYTLVHHMHDVKLSLLGLRTLTLLAELPRLQLQMRVLTTNAKHSKLTLNDMLLTAALTIDITLT